GIEGAVGTFDDVDVMGHGSGVPGALPRDFGDAGVRRTPGTGEQPSGFVGENACEPLRDVRAAVITGWHTVFVDRGLTTLKIWYATTNTLPETPHTAHDRADTLERLPSIRTGRPPQSSVGEISTDDYGTIAKRQPEEMVIRILF